MIKVFVITQNEPFYIPKMMNYLIQNQKKDYTICGFTVLKPTRKNKSFKDWYQERAKIYSWKELSIVGIAFFYSKMYSLFFKKTTPYNNFSILNNAGVRHFPSNDINSSEYIKMVNEIKPDIILSVSCPQLFASKLLEVPRLFCLNAHGTLLPRHRGVFGSFWSLFLNDKEAGGTLHTMELKLDAGEILWQSAFPILPNDTQYSIAYKTKHIMAKGLVDLFKIVNSGREITPILPCYDSKYHRAPSKEQGRQLKKQGKRIVVLSNLKLMLAKTFK